MTIEIKTEWLVRRVDRVGATEEQDARMTKRGDVIVVKRSPAVWSPNEYAKEDWVLIKTDMEMSDAELYLEQEPGDLEGVPLLKIRNKGLLLDEAVAEMATVDPTQIHKIQPPFSIPFEFSKELIAEYTYIKPPASRVF